MSSPAPALEPEQTNAAYYSVSEMPDHSASLEGMMPHVIPVLWLVFGIVIPIIPGFGAYIYKDLPGSAARTYTHAFFILSIVHLTLFTFCIAIWLLIWIMSNGSN